jgi:type I restriction enzyme R subunit
MPKEAKARIKINKLLEEAGWRFFDADGKKANILLENNTKITKSVVDSYGENYEKTTNGYIDFLLLDDHGKPFIVLEAKSDEKHPLSAKDQAHDYAVGKDCRYIILSNGDTHFFWDIEKGNPEQIVKFPSPTSLQSNTQFKPDRSKLINEKIERDYVVTTQLPTYAASPDYQNETTREAYVEKNGLRFLRPYQIEALQSIQQAMKNGKDRFLFEMATGTGKTLTAGAAIKLFLRSGNATRVLFLVDRLELEDQALKDLQIYLKNDYRVLIYKENRDDWMSADIVVTTVQSLLFNNKYLRIFSPTDFDLVISDEAHRSIGGNSRAVFEFFVGYKLGLTATPRRYLKNFDRSNKNYYEEIEKRQLKDTYATFGCDEDLKPTFQYDLVKGAKEGYLIQPFVVDARTEITTKLLSEEGYIVDYKDELGNEQEEAFGQRDFEKNFFSEKTNEIFCDTFLKKALRDPISNEIGKSIIYCVSQNHAAKITNLLNNLASQMFPEKYQSDFAVQVTSWVSDAQQYTINFRNNNLKGRTTFLEGYLSSKARVCVTVGMMTTGYDCPDILNLVLLRPIYSPTDFIQMKGRGTRRNNFRYEHKNELNEAEVVLEKKTQYKLFDFFANCEYFEEEFDYDEVISLPKTFEKPKVQPPPPPPLAGYESAIPDPLLTVKERQIGIGGMKIDRIFFQDFTAKIVNDERIKQAAKDGALARIEHYVSEKYLNKPDEYFTLEKLRKSLLIDRNISIRELLEKIFFNTEIKQKNELLDDEFDKFVSINKPDNADMMALKQYFKAYITDPTTRDIIDNSKYQDLYNNPAFTAADYQSVEEAYRSQIPDYIKNYVLNNQQFS